MTFVIKRIVPALILGTLATQSFACSDREPAISAVNNGNFEAAIDLQSRIAIDPSCDDALRLWLDERVARHYFEKAVATPGTEEKRELFLKSVDSFPHWRSYLALADLARTQKDRSEEARLLQIGINQMNDGPEHHTFTKEEAQSMIDRAAEAMLLSGQVMAPPRTRSGTPGGIFIESLRGFKVAEVKLAIEFDFDSTDFTKKGQGYADQLLSYLVERNPPKIVLEGHTDPKGPADYNHSLSLRRAESLRNYLLGQGYTGQIEVVGRGETNVPPAPSDIQPDSPEHYQLARRVVLIRG